MFTNSRDTHGCSEKYEEIPKEFFCPLSENFMSTPISVPSSDLTYNRDSIKNLYHPEDVQPNLILRKKMEEWLSNYVWSLSSTPRKKISRHPSIL